MYVIKNSYNERYLQKALKLANFEKNKGCIISNFKFRQLWGSAYLLILFDLDYLKKVGIIPT